MARAMSSSEIPLRAAFSSSTDRLYLGLIVFDVPVDIHDALGLLEETLEFAAPDRSFDP